MGRRPASSAPVNRSILLAFFARFSGAATSAVRNRGKSPCRPHDFVGDLIGFVLFRIIRAADGQLRPNRAGAKQRLYRLVPGALLQLRYRVRLFCDVRPIRRTRGRRYPRRFSLPGFDHVLQAISFRELRTSQVGSRVNS